MLFITSHRHAVQPEPPSPSASDSGCRLSVAAVCGFTASETPPEPAWAPFAPFGYFFPDAPVPPHDAGTTDALDALADAMLDEAQRIEDNSDVPAIITYLGQFIDHDTTAGTDRAVGFSDVDIADVAPLPRAEVRNSLANLRTGALDLDSVYGGAAVLGAFAREMQKRLRHPKLPAKLRIGTDIPVAVSGPRPARPLSIAEDPAHDLLRVERLIRDADPLMDAEALDDLPPDLRALLTDGVTGAPNPARAVIGDGRNDENLAVATVHLAFARLHNRVVDVAPEGDPDEVFARARQQVRWIYQWLLVNVYLPSICDTDGLRSVTEAGAPVYKAFLDRMPHAEGHMPMPLEFSAAAFRFGHSTARPDYDWNGNFGRAVPSGPAVLDRAGFELMFAFTGNGRMNDGASRLPSGWLADMPRFLNSGTEAHPDRNTRLIDTHLAPPLLRMINEPEGLRGVLRVLPRRNLRRSQRLAVPTAQACLDGLAAMGILLPRLSTADLRGGSTGHAMTDALAGNTPLWFYVLKEAEIFGDGLRLGPLGTRVVAETLFGLIRHGPGTYLHQSGSDGGRWHPRDGATPGGHPVDSLEALMRAALMA